MPFERYCIEDIYFAIYSKMHSCNIGNIFFLFIIIILILLLHCIVCNTIPTNQCTNYNKLFVSILNLLFIFIDVF